MKSNKKLLDEACVLALFRCLSQRRKGRTENHQALFAIYMEQLDSYLELFKEDGIDIMPVMENVTNELIKNEPMLLEKQSILKNDAFPDERKIDDTVTVRIKSVSSFKPQLDGFKGVRLLHEENGTVADNLFLQQCTGYSVSNLIWDDITKAVYPVFTGNKDSVDFEKKKTEALVRLSYYYAFEIKRICDLHPDAAQNIIRYLYGNEDLLSVLVNFDKGQAVIKSYNPGKTLNVPETRIPTKVINVAQKATGGGISNSTFVVTFDNGSQIEFRVFPVTTGKEKSIKAYSVEIKPAGVPIESHVCEVNA